MAQFSLSTTIEESDWDALFALDWACFASDPAIAAFTPCGLEPAYRARNVQAFRTRTFGGEVERIYAVLSDPSHSSGRNLVSFISCRVYRCDPSPGLSTGQPGKLPRGPPEEDSRQAYYERFWAWVMRRKTQIDVVQKPHVYVQMLGTHPGWRRQGAATRLLEWVMDFVQRERLGRCVLKASEETIATGFYERLGFQVVDRARYTEGKGEEMVIMVKEVSDSG